MSYDLGLTDSITGEFLELGGSSTAELNITCNYAKHFVRVLGEGGIRSLYGKAGGESVALLKTAISLLADDVGGGYWKATEGNAKRALTQCLALAYLRPDGVWRGD
jgi:hypothetical protein